MGSRELMQIGAFARRAGLTASALRFYDDAGVLMPAMIEPETGYRLYDEQQLAQASQLKLLREIGMPLSHIAEFLSADAADALALVDQQVAAATADAARVHSAAARLRGSLVPHALSSIAVLPGPLLAAAIDQVLGSAIDHPEIPVLGGVHIEVEPGCLSLTATDRYRLTTRTLVPSETLTFSWAGTACGGDLRAATSRLRRGREVTLEADEHALRFRVGGAEPIACRLLRDGFPEYRVLTQSLAAVTHRVTLERRQIIHLLDAHIPERAAIRVAESVPRLVMRAAGELPLNGAAIGGSTTVWFELTTLYPALSQTLGPDLMLELRGTQQPATVRSADDGDLATLVMPCAEPI